MTKRTWFWISAVAVLAVVAFLALWTLRQNRARQTAAIETVAVRRDTILATVTASGTILPAQSLKMVFPSGGVLASLSVRAGQQVKKGDELARLDSRQLQLAVDQAEAALKISQARLAQTQAGATAADLAAAEASVESAQGAYETARKKTSLKGDQLALAESDLKRTELALQDAQAAYDRISWRADIGMLPQASALQRATLDYERAQSNYKLQVAAIDDTAFRTAAAQLAQAKAQLERLRQSPTAEELAIAEAQVAQSQASLDAARLRVIDATLVAPFSGTVVSTGAEVGESVSAATPVVILADLDRFYVEATIDESDIGRIQEGQDVTIILDAFPDVTLRGSVSRLDPLGKVAQGVVTYWTRIDVLAKDVPLRPNMTATVDIVVQRKADVMLVPNRAVKRATAGRYTVDVWNGKAVDTRNVTIGLSNDTVTEIVSGLQTGEEVVISSSSAGLLQRLGQRQGLFFGGASR
ncbi:MAG TPA: efflux RND transporter periplasmic adaptor subunit [Anaerolineae bacterium]|nr:efflux RND transporter periplasmic adaptor subunit [Anaerolineae bacterium]HNT05360.1 efflux RND transporter periplasmic adaptor subunit [Anaerolineae bacterium]